MEGFLLQEAIALLAHLTGNFLLLLFFIFTCRLALGVQGVNVHGEVEFVTNDLLVLPSKLVSTIDALGVPVCPVQAVFKHRDGKGMWEA